MEPGQSSRTEQEEGDDSVWATLVPNDPSYSSVEIRSMDTVVCSETLDSSSEKHEWCRIVRKDLDSAEITNMSSHAITVNGIVVKEETVHLKGGSEIISGPDRKGHLGYSFELIPREEDDRQCVKISLDAEHAKCSICLNVWHDVVTTAPCFHNFCNGCFSEWLRRSSKQSRDRHQNVVCPQCRATVHSVGRNHFLHNIEEAILDAFSSLKRSDEEITLLDTYASIKPNLILEMPKSNSKKRTLSVSNDEGNDVDLPCLQCGTELGGFRCVRATAHIQCQGCGGLMPSRPNIAKSLSLVNAQRKAHADHQIVHMFSSRPMILWGHPLLWYLLADEILLGMPGIGCDKAFCGAYWSAQGVDATDVSIICSRETFKQISVRTISRLPDSVHQNNLHERNVTEKCIQQTGQSLQSLISEWITKFDNREVDRSRLQLKHAGTITSRTYLCNDCYIKLVDFLLYWFRVTTSRSLLPPDVAQREDCWYGYLCRTQHHNAEHAQKRNHVCRPTRGPMHLL